MPDDKLLDSLRGRGPDDKNALPTNEGLGGLPLLRSLSKASQPSRTEAGQGLLNAIKSGLAESKEIISDGRVAADGTPLPDKAPEKLSDGTIESGFVPEINEPGILGDLAKDEFVESNARNAVEIAQQQGLTTLSSGFDPGRNMGWAIGQDKDGDIVRVEAEPDPEDSPFPGSNALDGALGIEKKDTLSPFGVDPTLGGIIGDVAADAPAPPQEDFLDFGDFPTREETPDEKFDRVMKEQVRKTAGLDPLSISALAAQDPDLQRLIAEGTEVGAVKLLRKEKQAAMRKELDALPASVLVLAAQLKDINAPDDAVQKLLGIALEQRRRDVATIKQAQEDKTSVPVETLLGSGRTMDYVQGKLPVDVDWSPEAQQRLADLNERLLGAHDRVFANDFGVKSSVFVGERKATVLEDNGDTVKIRFEAGADPVQEVSRDAISTVAPISLDPLKKFDRLPAHIAGDPTGVQEFKDRFDAARADGTLVLGPGLQSTQGAIADPDLIEAAELLLAKRAIWEKRYRDFHNRKVNPFADVPGLGEIYRMGIAPAVRGAASFVDTVTLGLVPLSELGDEDDRESLDIAGGASGKFVKDLAAGAGQAAGIVVPFAGAGKIVGGATNAVSKGGRAGAIAARGLRVPAVDSALTFSVFDTAQRMATNLKEGRTILDQVDEAALKGAKNGLIFSGLGVMNRALLRGADPSRVKAATESFLNGAEFMALEDPEAFENPASVAGMLGAFALMGAAQGKPGINGSNVGEFLFDPGRVRRLRAAEAGETAGKGRIKTPKDIDEVDVVAATTAMSPTLRSRIERRVETEGLKSDQDIADASKSELDTIADVIVDPRGRAMEDVIVAKAALNEIIFAEQSLLGMSIAGGASGTGVGDLARFGFEMAKDGRTGVARALGIFPGAPIRGALSIAGKAERVFFDPTTGKPTKIGKPFDVIAKALTGEKSLLAALTAAGKKAGMPVPWLFGKATGISTEQAADRLSRWIMTAQARGGEEYGALLREVQAAKRYEGPRFTYADVKGLQSLPTAQRTTILDAWRQGVGAGRGKPGDFGRALLEGDAQVTLPPRFDLPGLPATVNIDGVPVPIAQAIGMPTFFLNTLRAIAKQSPDVEAEGLSTGEKSAASRKRNTTAATMELLSTLYMQRRLGFEPNIPAEMQGLFDRATKLDNPNARVLRTLAARETSLASINQELANVAIMDNLSSALSKKRKPSSAFEGKAGADLAVNYTPDGMLMDRPLVRRDAADGYVRLDSPIVGKDAADLYYREDIKTDFESFSSQAPTILRWIGKAVNTIRFSRVTASFGGTVRDMIGDAYLNYLDLGPDGFADTWRAGGWGGSRLPGLPTTREMISLNREVTEQDLTTVDEKVGQVARDVSGIRGGRSVVEIARGIIERGDIGTDVFEQALMAGMRSAGFKKQRVAEALDHLDGVFSKRLGKGAVEQARMNMRSRKGLSKTEVEALRSVGTGRAKIKELDAKQRLPRASGGVILLRDWALADAAFRQGVIGNTFSEAELTPPSPRSKSVKFAPVAKPALDALKEFLSKKEVETVLEAGDILLGGSPVMSRSDFIASMKRDLSVMVSVPEGRAADVAALSSISWRWADAHMPRLRRWRSMRGWALGSERSTPRPTRRTGSLTRRFACEVCRIITRRQVRG